MSALPRTTPARTIRQDPAGIRRRDPQASQDPQYGKNPQDPQYGKNPQHSA
ncbi:hypothetical protein ACFT0G_30555 [Streptomyces sp. NPDC057020]|uniref:hypothetical protein n=1 Tax=unclassified Streptomyces TaxID=2593676 RepID=UPI00362EAE4D